MAENRSDAFYVEVLLPPSVWKPLTQSYPYNLGFGTGYRHSDFRDANCERWDSIIRPDQLTLGSPNEYKEVTYGSFETMAEGVNLSRGISNCLASSKDYGRELFAIRISTNFGRAVLDSWTGETGGEN
ncbi:hypothetical protein Pla52o_48140 [Novipirellula galeiformis]|uniref:Uncharacterized protein n=1 Tax=Novipirellula galeiformis TaxID=2528004 RepID=A0A5C6C871_9BACT|nr:hypothetical protein [Novipirellula galeiformis]TWU20295.1 hypothetical protein Pla52o_48140 [Novipirellula galeiformis]